MPLKNGRTTAALQAIVVGNTIPAGVIQAFGGGAVPTGWLLCDGSVVSRTTYAGLFAAISDKNGNGDGSTTFHLPDLRGRFVRGADDMGTGAAGRDPDAAGRTASNAGGATGNAVGSVQDDAFQNITGTSNRGRNRSNGFTDSSTGAITAGGTLGSTNWGSGGGTWRSENFDASQSPGAKTSTETRPANANTAYIIKV